MSESRLEKSPLSQAKGASSSLQYPVRRMRNTAVLVKWIEEHQSNPYPTKAEKQYLAYYSGMNLTQLSTWFANARRRIKKIGMKTWLEGRSTFTVDLFPSPTLQPTRPMTGESCTYGYAAASPYAAGLTGSYAYSTLSYPTQHPSAAIGLQAAQRVQNGPTNVYASDTSSLYQTSISSGSTMNGLYGTTQQRMSQPLIGMPAFNWPTMPAATPLSLTTTSTGNLQQSRPSSNTGPLHSPLTAYSADTLRTHSGQSTLDVAADGSTYSLQQPSPAEQMLPECASTEPILQGSPKTHYAAQASVTD